MDRKFAIKTIVSLVIVTVLITIFVLKERQNISKVGATVEFLLALNGSLFLIGTASDVGIYNVENGNYESLPSLTESKCINLQFYDGRSCDHGELYITSDGCGCLLNSKLKIVRQDSFEDQLNNRDFDITPNGHIAAFSNSNMATFSWGTEVTIINLISGMTLKKLENDSIPIFISHNENHSLITAKYSKSRFSHLSEREIGTWKIKSDLDLRTSPTCMAQELNKQKLIVGTEKGTLLFCDISPLSLSKEIQVSTHRITAICPLTNLLIAVGDSKGNIFIVDTATRQKRKLSVSGTCQFVTCIAYSSNSLIAGFWNSRVQYWNLDNIVKLN